jgi:tetraacyldisaccharide 4'-kinase
MTWLERQWQGLTPASLALYPVSLLFRAVTALRRAGYTSGLLRVEHVRVPVIIVGNITVGGTGKTPLVLWLASLLQRHGMRPGIVSRGYGTTIRAAREVRPDSDAAHVGDEPLLLARRSGCPVFVGIDRVAAANALLAAHASCDVIVADDGLQHYRLARDVEIAVVDGARGLGNRMMLPAGPLREPPSRLDTLDAVVVNGTQSGAWPRAYAMRLEARQFRNVLNPDFAVDAAHFRGKRVLAIAGIGNPARFFTQLEALGIEFEARPFPDHHAYTRGDLALAQADAIVMTEKDAVKCALFASASCWVLPVDAELDPALGELVLRKLRITRL